MNEEKREENYQKSNKELYIVISVTSLVAILTIISFVNPYLLVGWYLDRDIEELLLNAHQSRYLTDDADNKTKNDLVVGVRLTFKNDQIVESRVNNAIKIFDDLFENYHRVHSIKKNENDTTLELKWSMKKKDGS